jgi:hypothetical protein
MGMPEPIVEESKENQTSPEATDVDNLDIDM